MNYDENIKNLPQEVKKWALDGYLANEVGSDEYRDTQPGNGLTAAANYPFSDMTRGLNADDIAMLKEIRTWIDSIITETENAKEGEWTAYAGCDELDPVLTRSFNSMWDRGFHPYGYDAAQILADYNEAITNA
jgi:hypothetical protein